MLFFLLWLNLMVFSPSTITGAYLLPRTVLKP